MGSIILLCVLFIGFISYLLYKRLKCDHDYKKMRVDASGRHVRARRVKVSFIDSLNGVNRPFEKCIKCGHINKPIVREHPTEQELLEI
jgi:hypothetical protein